MFMPRENTFSLQLGGFWDLILHKRKALDIGTCS